MALNFAVDSLFNSTYRGLQTKSVGFKWSPPPLECLKLKVVNGFPHQDSMPVPERGGVGCGWWGWLLAIVIGGATVLTEKLWGLRGGLQLSLTMGIMKVAEMGSATAVHLSQDQRY
ncbi:hypothetical protein SLE2022_120420 [Rubroshorea leprosula]